MIKFTVDGRPQPKQRPRFSCGKVFTPKETKWYEQLVGLSYKQVSKKYFEKELLQVSIQLYFNPAKNISKKKLALYEKETYPYEKHIDIDNIAKSILDGLNGVAYKDDCQVVDLRIQKYYTLKNERAEIEIKEYKKCMKIKAHYSLGK